MHPSQGRSHRNTYFSLTDPGKSCNREPKNKYLIIIDIFLPKSWIKRIMMFCISRATKGMLPTGI